MLSPTPSPTLAVTVGSRQHSGGQSTVPAPLALLASLLGSRSFWLAASASSVSNTASESNVSSFSQVSSRFIIISLNPRTSATLNVFRYPAAAIVIHDSQPHPGAVSGPQAKTTNTVYNIKLT
ncbi:Protein of unknown function [Cotesia congregata]|uniref:Uncharacterized protein n=1 Tax=Cotesia congregata TaxID=51543 RepID=A0A8J2H7W3_COTCN|nr:Protein of unknown function [Cotesia congregata]